SRPPFSWWGVSLADARLPRCVAKRAAPILAKAGRSRPDFLAAVPTAIQ
ncbi:transcriptional regulator, partial [Burkholderia pseudomallei]